MLNQWVGSKIERKRPVGQVYKEVQSITHAGFPWEVLVDGF
jgi:hypothetical protein